MAISAKVTLDDFGSLYGKFGPMVLRRCRYLLGDEEQALDAMQDVFVRVLERREKLSSACSSFFYTIATTVCLNRIRSNRVRYAPRIDEILDSIADTGRNHEELTDTTLFLDYIFAETKEDTRTMATLHYVDGLTLEETAQAMNMSVSGIRKRLDRLRHRARHCEGAHHENTGSVTGADAQR